MHSRNTLDSKRGSLNVGLYSIVFFSKTTVNVVLFLFLSFLIQPIHQAAANEATEDGQTDETETLDLEITTPADVIFDEAEDVSEAGEISDENLTETEEIEENTEQTIEVETTEDDTVSVIEPDDSESVTTYSDSEEDSSSNATSSGEEIDDGFADDSSDEVATSTVETIDNNASTTSESTKENSLEGADTASSTDISEEDSVSTSTENEIEDETSTSSDDASENSNSSSDNETTTSSEETDNSNSDGTIATSSEETDNSNSDGTIATSSEETDNSTTDDSASDTEEEVANDSETKNDSTSADTNFSDEEDKEMNIGDEIIEEGVSGIVNEVVNLTRQLVTEENYYQFSRQSCVPVGDGTFHCTTKNDLPIDLDSAVFSEQDDEGDMEIYLRTSKGDVKKITDNQYDDTSPDVDHLSMRVVWQRLIDGRYQIFSYDLNEQKETQLTFSRTNSMEPKVSREGIVWQAWDGEDWEIVFYDGQFTDIITDNKIQDVTPVIEDGYILWSILGGKEQEARVYSIESKEIMTISGHEGGAVANPRFVLVYDTKFDNGDVVTQGFDPVTGLSAPISAQPAELPLNIPEPDPIGEIVALIQSKKASDENDIVVSDKAPSDGELNLASTTVDSPDTIKITNLDDSLDTASNLTLPDLELTEFDLIITEDAASTTSNLNKDYEIIGAPKDEVQYLDVATTTG